MKINKFWFPIIVLVLFFGSIMVGMATGAWQTEGKKEFKVVGGKLDVNSVKGSHTIADIVSTFHLKKDEFYKAFELPSNFSPTKKLKDIVKYLKEKDPEKFGNISMNYVREKLDKLINK